MFLDKMPFIHSRVAVDLEFFCNTPYKKNTNDVITFTKLYYDSGQAVHRAVESAFFHAETCKENRQFNV